MSTTHNHETIPGPMRLARHLYDPRSTVLNVTKDADWTWMREHPKELLCAVPGCEMRVEPVDRLGSKFLRNSKGKVTELAARGGGGGPMTPEHKWLQRKVLKECQDLGFSAEREVGFDKTVCIDVLVEKTWAVEIQLVPTNIPQRTYARHRVGLNSLWMIPLKLQDEATTSQLFSQPVVRFRVVEPEGNYRVGNPWFGSGEEEPLHEARILIFGTVFRRVPSSPYLGSGQITAEKFFHQVFSGQRQWLSARAVHNLFPLPAAEVKKLRAGWYMKSDVTWAATRVKLDQSLRVESRPEVITAVEPSTQRQPSIEAGSGGEGSTPKTNDAPEPHSLAVASAEPRAIPKAPSQIAKVKKQDSIIRRILKFLIR